MEPVSKDAAVTAGIDMIRMVGKLFLSLALACASADLCFSGGAEGVPDQSTAHELADAWLRFHESGLCRGVDAVFVFDHNGMTVSGTVLDDKSDEKFQELLKPLGSAFTIVLHLDRPAEEANAGDKPDRDKNFDPPASLWENYELRSFLGDPFARARDHAGVDDELSPKFPPPDENLKQRLRIYGEQTLEWNGAAAQYARHLDALTQLAANSGLNPHFRARAHAAATAHAKEVDRLLGKLSANLSHAMPHSRKSEPVSQREKGFPKETTIVERARNISETAQSVSSRVHQFIHPEHFTVELDELRRPSLLASLKDLRKMNAEFLSALGKMK